MWVELFRSPGGLHAGMRLSSHPKTNRDSSLSTIFCQSVTSHVVLAWNHCRRSRQCFNVKSSTRKRALGITDLLPQVVWKLVLWNNWISLNLRNFPKSFPKTRHCGIHDYLPHYPSILSPCRLPGPSSLGTPHLGTIWCILLPTYSDSISEWSTWRATRCVD